MSDACCRSLWGGRAPIPHYLRYQAEFPATYRKLQELWEQEKEGEAKGGA